MIIFYARRWLVERRWSSVSLFNRKPKRFSVIFPVIVRLRRYPKPDGPKWREQREPNGTPDGVTKVVRRYSVFFFFESSGQLFFFFLSVRAPYVYSISPTAFNGDGRCFSSICPARVVRQNERDYGRVAVKNVSRQKRDNTIELCGTLDGRRNNRKK